MTTTPTPDPVKPARRRGWRVPFFTLLVLVIATSALLVWLARIPLGHARDEWRAGRPSRALEELGRWSILHVQHSEYDRMYAINYLTARKPDLARPFLERLRTRDSAWFPTLHKDEVARRFVSAGQYQAFLDYDRASRERREDASVALYRAAAQLGLNRIAEADAAFREIEEKSVDAAKYAALKVALEQRRQGSFPWVIDRSGGTIAVYQIANSDVVALNTEFAGLVEREAGASTFEARLPSLGSDNAIRTTLDAGVQHAAMQALGGFRGSLVAIDPRTNELLAVASNRAGGPLQNLALDAQYEPGSVIKVLTGMTALRNGIDFKTFFPLTCTGWLDVDGRQFHDWAPHGPMADVNEALSVSCNVAFAKMGIQLGRDRLAQTLTAAGFDSIVNLGAFDVPLGKNVGRVFNNFETGFYAIGLEHESVTALHVAMLASMMANRGVLTTPSLILSRQSILGEPVGAAIPQSKTTVAPKETAEVMIGAMRAVVTSPKGTGRRAAVDGLELALKTGTAGKQEQGYHAVILAFAPADHPRIAIGMIAESAGPAEYAGAKIAHDFFEAVKARP
jgi:peptidoglycan glycosyltransferase